MPTEPRLRIHPEHRQLSRELRHPLTPSEQRLWRVLRNRNLDNYKFRRQHAIGPFIVDFYCAQAKLVIEVDGDIHARQVEYDAARTEWLQNMGYQVVRFTNEEVLNQLSATVAEIQHICQELTGAMG